MGGAAAHVWNALMCAYAPTRLQAYYHQRPGEGRAGAPPARRHARTESGAALARAQKKMYLLFGLLPQLAQRRPVKSLNLLAF